MKIGIWHEGLVGKDLQIVETSFQTYASQYVKFIKENNIERAFFIMHDPNGEQGKYLKNGWFEKYWLNELPSNCEAGFVIDTEPDSPWVNSNPILTFGDSMELAFKYISKLNNTPGNKQITCVGFDGENLSESNKGWGTGYYSTNGVNWINSMVSKYINSPDFDWAFAGQSSHADRLNNYREVYWVGEMVDCGCTGVLAKKNSKKCQCPNTPYCTYSGDPSGILTTPIGTYLENPILTGSTIWPMFSVESSSKLDCVAMPNAKYSAHPCGLMDAFGVWDKKSFMDFLSEVESKYGIKQAMIYEWQFIPQDWVK